MGQVFSIDDEPVEAIDTTALMNPVEGTAELPIPSALEAIQSSEEARAQDADAIHLGDLLSGRRPTRLADRVSQEPRPESPRAAQVFENLFNPQPVSSLSIGTDLDQAIEGAVLSVDQNHNAVIQKHIAEVDRKQDICNDLLEARRHLNRAKDGELELTQELFDKLLALEEHECRVLDETTKREFLESVEEGSTYVLTAESLAEMKSLAGAHTDRLKGEISRDFSTKLQPAFSDMQSILESLKKMMESRQREKDVMIRNQRPG